MQDWIDEPRHPPLRHPTPSSFARSALVAGLCSGLLLLLSA